MKNWAGNQTYSSVKTVAPSSLDELQELVAQAPKIRPLGTRHCFNLVADTSGVHVSLEHFHKIEEPDPTNQTVTFGGGVTYGHLAPFLEERGWALHNLASLPHISVAGAVATATHGSGLKNGNLTTALRRLECVNPDGSLAVYEGEDLKKRAVHLGAFGPVHRLTLAIEPNFQVRQWVFKNVPFQPFFDNPTSLYNQGYSVSLFTTWSKPSFDQVWVKSRLDQDPQPPETLFDQPRVDHDLHPLEGIDPVNCTAQVGLPGPWYDRLPHFRLEFTPSAGEELQSEFFVDATDAPRALQALLPLSDKLNKVLFVSELRYIAADNLLLSPACGQDVIAFHFTWKPDWPAVQPVLAEVQSALAPFHPRPHLGKLFLDPASLAPNYPGFAEFNQLVKQTDLEGKFSNPFLESLFS